MSESSPERAIEVAKERALENERNLYDEYLRHLGIRDEDLRTKVVADIGAGARMFGAHVLREGLTEKMYSVEPDVKGVFPEEQKQLELTTPPELRRKLDEMTFEAGREALPFEDGSIDLLVNHGAMPGSEWYEHQDFEEVREEINDSFDEVLRVLKDGGEARLFPLNRYDEGWGTEWRRAIEEKLEELRERGVDVDIEEADRWQNPDGFGMVSDRVIIRKSRPDDDARTRG